MSDQPMALASEPQLDSLVEELARLDGPADLAGVWPEGLVGSLSRAGVFRWALPVEGGGAALSRSGLLTRYARVAEGSMTAAFILSQHDAAVRRLVAAGDRPVARRWLGAIGEGRAFATVGLSQLTTSKRHGDQAVRAEAIGPGRYRVDGMVPWVTAAPEADVLVVGAVTDDGQQLLIALPADRAGVDVRPPFALAALQASCTSEVECRGVEVGPDDLLAGPEPDVMANPTSAGTGGLETSALAMGLALAALKGIEAQGRDDLIEPAQALRAEWDDLWKDPPGHGRRARGRPDRFDHPGPGQCPGPPDHPGLSDRPERVGLPARRPGPALGPAGALLPGLVVPEPRRQGVDPRPGRALLDLTSSIRPGGRSRRGRGRSPGSRRSPSHRAGPCP